MNREIRLVVIGCGSIGKRHLTNLLKLGCRNLFAFDVNPHALDGYGARAGVRFFSDFGRLAGARPQAALICTPTAFHLRDAERALELGCHLFIEKPISHTSRGVAAMLQEAARRRLLVMSGFNWRFNKTLLRLKKLIDEGALGRVVSAHAHCGSSLAHRHPVEDYRRTYAARKDLGGGVILDAIHEFDYVCWLLGKPRTLVSFAGKLSRLQIETEDVAHTLLEMQSRTIAHIDLDYVQRPPTRYCWIVGDLGTAHADLYAGRLRWFDARRNRWHSYAGDDNLNEMYVEEMRHFLRCLRTGEQPVPDGNDGLRVLEVALAAKESVRRGRRMRWSPSGWGAT